MQAAINGAQEIRQCSVEIIKMIESGHIRSRKQLEKKKALLSKKHVLGRIIKNAQIIPHAKNPETIRFLQMKPVRTASGVATIAVMWKFRDEAGPCPASCVYCPKGSGIDALGTKWDAPKSYTGSEPTTQRALRFNYDPYAQIQNRLMQFNVMGHPADKCELIIMGGTFTSVPFDYQKNFVKSCFDSFNRCKNVSLEEAQKTNETAKHRCIGLTIETRADYCSDGIVQQMLSLGTTRVEIGVQSTDDNILKLINRGNDAQANIDAFARLRNAGLKITAHWMPGLTGLERQSDAEGTGLDMKKEVKGFKKLFFPEYQPDEIKIYPALVIKGTKLYDLWQHGKYQPLTDESFIELLAKLKQSVPEHVRIKNVMRDISHNEASAGASRTNLRQIVNKKMAAQNIRCKCIRCREAGLRKEKPENAEMLVKKYDAAGGIEYFISAEGVKQNLLLGFIRLRIFQSGAISQNAFIRELHVYGKLVPIGEKPGDNLSIQHRGIGKALLQKAEEICISSGIKKLRITSGIGAREYYRKHGYQHESYYMTKAL